MHIKPSANNISAGLSYLLSLSLFLVPGLSMLGMGIAMEKTVNHPFLYFITERQTGAILFIGMVDDPTQN